MAFSELGRSIDVPEKNYSTGMYMRLGFAITARLPADLLLIDEVLAMGDAGFQEECLGRMAEAHGAGATVLLVSHNMETIPGIVTARTSWSADRSRRRATPRRSLSGTARCWECGPCWDEASWRTPDRQSEGRHRRGDGRPEKAATRTALR